jgi:hypothetical protein
MAQNVLSISEFEDFNEWKRDGNVIRNSDGSYSTQDANFRNRLEDMEELQRYYKREFVGSYAKGGKMENMYKIVDIDGDTVESNLNEQEVIEFADSLGYYEAQDNEEEPIYDIDSAISLIEMEGDYTVVKMSEYGGSVYAYGGKVAKVGEPYDSMTKYQLEKEFKKLTEKRDLLKKKYGSYEAEEITEIEKEIDKIITLLYGENFSGVGQKYFYAKGGKVAKFDAYEVAGELAELADGVWDKLGITDGGMLYNDESLQAKVNEEYAKAGIDEMFKALSTVNRKKVAEALTDENNHNVRNYLALRGYLGVAEKRSYTNLFKKSGKYKIVLNPTIFGVKPLVSDISTYVPHSKVLSITIKKGDKEYNLTGSDILDGVYVKDGEFKRGGVMKTLRRWWKKLNGTWYYNEGAGWRRDRKFQNKSEKYEKDGRSTYKQVTRGYVDDMPYEYADGGMTQKMFFGDASIEWKDRNGEQKSERFRKYIKAKNKGEAYRFFLKFIEDETNQFDENLVKNFLNVDEVETQDEMENALFMGYLSDKNYYAKGGYVDMREKLTKELMKLQRELSSGRLSTYIEGDTSEEEMARSRERESKLARFNDILKTLNEMDKSPKYAKGGVVVTSIKDIPDFKEELNAGRISYRGLGMGKVADDFYKLAGESGTRIKVKGKEYFITDTEFDTFSRDASGRLRVRFDAPFRRFAKGGDVTVPEKIEYSSMFSAIPRSTDNENVV